MSSLKVFLLTILCLGIVILSVIVLLKIVSPKPNQPYNVHTWRLPDDSSIKYYEISDGHTTFTANLDQTLVYQKGTSEKKYHVGFGGSYESLKLYFSKNGNIIWLMGRYAGEKSSYIISAMDIQNDIFIETAKIRSFPEKELTEKERELRKQLIIEEGVIVPEVKK